METFSNEDKMILSGILSHSFHFPENCDLSRSFSPIQSHSLACSARAAGMLSRPTETEAASSDRVRSRRTDAAIELAPSTEGE